MCARRSAQGDGGCSSDNSSDTGRFPLPSEGVQRTRAKKQAMLDLINQLIREADAVGVRIQGMTIAPSPSRHLPAGSGLPLPEVVAVEGNDSGHCIVTVQPPAGVSDSNASGPTDLPSEAETASVGRHQPAGDDMDGTGGLSGEGSGGGGGDVGGVHGKDEDAAMTESGNGRTD